MFVGAKGYMRKKVTRKAKGASLDWLNPLYLLEAASGFEPLNKGFADLCLTTWLRRHE
jgi:hypothetical protein